MGELLRYPRSARLRRPQNHGTHLWDVALYEKGLMDEIRMNDELQTPFQRQQGGAKSAHSPMSCSPPSSHHHSASPDDEPVSSNRSAPLIIEREFASPGGGMALTIECEAHLGHRGKCSSSGSRSIIRQDPAARRGWLCAVACSPHCCADGTRATCLSSGVRQGLAASPHADPGTTGCKARRR